MKPYSDRFFSDLAKLIRHGPEPFDRLIEDLSDPDRRQRLIEALIQMRNIASESKTASRSVPKQSRPFAYDDIQTPKVPGGDPEIIEMLHDIRKKLTMSPTLKSRRVMEDLAHQLSTPVVKRDSIPRIIQKILTNLSTRDAEEVAEALSWVKEADRGSTESFMDLASFITRSPTNN